MTNSVEVDQVWQTKEGIPGDTAGIQILITVVTTVDEVKKIPYVDFVYLKDRHKQSYGMPVSRLLHEFELVSEATGPELDQEDEITISQGDTSISGRIDDLDYNWNEAGDRVGPIRAVAFYGIPGWFRIVGEHAWTITEHTPAKDNTPVAQVVSARLRNESIPDQFWYVDEGDVVDPYYVDDVGVKHLAEDLQDIQPLLLVNPANSAEIASRTGVDQNTVEVVLTELEKGAL